MAAPAATSSSSPANLNTLLISVPEAFEAGNGAQGRLTARADRQRHRCRSIGTGVRTERRSTSYTLIADLTGDARGDRHRAGARGPGNARSDVHEPRAAADAARTSRRREGPPAAAQAARGRRAGRLPERGQVDDHLAHFGGEAEDCRVPVHYPRAQPRRRRPVGRSVVRRRRRSRPDRRRTPGTRARPSIPQPPRADARAGARHRRVVDRGARSGRGFPDHHTRAGAFPGRDSTASVFRKADCRRCEQDRAGRSGRLDACELPGAPGSFLRCSAATGEGCRPSGSGCRLAEHRVSMVEGEAMVEERKSEPGDR